MDIVLNRADLNRARQVLETAGFPYQEVAGDSLFLDGSAGTPRDAVHLVFAGEKVRVEYPESAASIEQCEWIKSMRTLALPELIRMKLTSHRFKDRVHIQDMISVGLIDETWLGRFSPELRLRLKELLDHPDA